MRFILLMILVIVFLRVCIEVRDSSGISPELEPVEGGEEVKPNTAIKPYQPPIPRDVSGIRRKSQATVSDKSPDEIRELGERSRRVVDNMFEVFERFVSIAVRFRNGYESGGRKAAGEEQLGYHDNSPPRADQVVAPSEGLEGDSINYQINKVGRDVNHETGLQPSSRNHE